MRVKNLTVQIEGSSLEAPTPPSGQKLTSGQCCKLLQKHSPQKTSGRNLKRQNLYNLIFLCCFRQCLLEVFLFHTVNCIVAYKHLFKGCWTRWPSVPWEQCMVKDCRNAEYWVAFDGEILKVFCVCSNTDKNYNQNTFRNCHGVSYLEKHLSCKSKWFLYYFKLQTLLKCKLGKWRSWRLEEHWWFIYYDVPPCWAILKLIPWGCLAQFSCIKRGGTTLKRWSYRDVCVLQFMEMPPPSAAAISCFSSLCF